MPNYAIMQVWEESERGWGVRPDGASFHLSIPDCNKYINAYWKSMPDEIPDEYSRPRGSAYMVTVSDKLFEMIQAAEGNNVRLYRNDDPEISWSLFQDRV